MKQLVLLAMMLMPLTAGAQKQYFLPTGDETMGAQDRPMIEVYLPKEEVANGCAVVLCPGGAMRWLSWENDVVKMAEYLNERGIVAIGLRYHLNKGQMPRGMQMPPMVDVTHPERFPQADANPMHNASGDSIIRLAAEDAKAAIRMVREHADAWHLSKNKIGYLGFSAGGGVGIGATVRADALHRPAFIATIYGPSLIDVEVPENAPKLFIATRGDHHNVAAGLVSLYLDWKRAGANAEMHLYDDGTGPFGPDDPGNTSGTWRESFYRWITYNRF